MTIFYRLVLRAVVSLLAPSTALTSLLRKALLLLAFALIQLSHLLSLAISLRYQLTDAMVVFFLFLVVVDDVVVVVVVVVAIHPVFDVSMR